MADLPNAAAVLFFDTFEKAGIETQEWIVQALLPLLVNSALGLTMVLAGQKIPALTRAWRHQHEHTRLTGLSTADWTDYAEQYAKRHGRPRPEASQLALLHWSQVKVFAGMSNSTLQLVLSTSAGRQTAFRCNIDRDAGW